MVSFGFLLEKSLLCSLLRLVSPTTLWQSIKLNDKCYPLFAKIQSPRLNQLLTVSLNVTIMLRFQHTNCSDFPPQSEQIPLKPSAMYFPVLGAKHLK